MKTVEVVAAVIKKEDAIFATQRGYGDFAGGWEFAVDGFLTTVDYDYPTFHLTMHCYVCHVSEGRLHLLEHSAAKWLTLDAIGSVEWLPADVAVVEAIRAQKIIG